MKDEEKPSLVAWEPPKLLPRTMTPPLLADAFVLYRRETIVPEAQRSGRGPGGEEYWPASPATPPATHTAISTYAGIRYSTVCGAR